MGKTVSDFIIDRMHAWGVRHVYGYPGDGINGLLGAFARQEDRVRFIQTRHEEMAAFMACAHAKWTGEPGVCVATSGPGAIHLLNGLYDAAKDNQPVVAIIGQQKRMSLGGDYQQEVDLISLFKDVAKHYVHMVAHPLQARTQIDQAFRIARGDRAVTCVIVPADVQEADAQVDPPRMHGSVVTGVGYSPPKVVPQDQDLERAATILNEGKKVAMLVGAGCLGAEQEVMKLAEALGAGVSKALLGKAVIDDALPYCAGAIGLLGTEPSYHLMMKCDTLLMIGTNFPYSEWLPKEGDARCVQINIKPRHLSLRYPADVALHGDARSTMQALLPLLKRKDDRSWQEGIEKNVAKWWKVLEARAHNKADPMPPQRVFWELCPKLPDNVILSADSGSAANWFARDLKVRPPMKASLSGGLATMLPGVPYATAAKFTHPDRPSIAFVGDGAMQMLGSNGLITVAKHWKEWADPRLIVCVLNNGDLNQVTWEQRVMAGDPKFDASQRVPGFSFAKYAQDLGLEALEVRDPEMVVAAWDRALGSQVPFVLDCHVDPNVPPLPPHIKFEQARKYLTAILKGDPDSVATVKQSMKGMLESFMPSLGGKD
jgi:pyruvate dehydrogenase (quinone)